MPFKFSQASLARLKGVHPQLIQTAFDALELSAVDFGIADKGGLRTPEMQRQLVNAGASRTLNSKHLPQPDGYGHAIDIVPFIGGKPDLNTWQNYFTVGAAISKAAKANRLALRWGGAWVNIDGMDAKDLAEAVEVYARTRKAVGRRPLFDLAHFEILLITS